MELEKIYHNLVDEIFKGQNNFSSISRKNFKKCMDVYDAAFFDGELYKELQTHDIRYTVRRESNYVGVLTVDKLRFGYKYLFQINPKAISIVKKKYNDLDNTTILQIAIEQLIIHVLSHSWGFYNSEKYNDKSFKCIMNECFPRGEFYKITAIHINQPSESESDSDEISENDLSIGLLENKSSSCYIDSLLLSILVGAAKPFYKKNLLEVDIQASLYKDNKFLGDEVDEDILDNIRNIRDAIVEIDNSIFNEKENLFCTDLRKFLGKIDKKFIRGQYTPTELYSVLGYAFPDILSEVENEKYKISSKTGIRESNADVEKLGIITFFDFVNIDTIGQGSNFLFENTRTDVLVFSNQIYPYIKKYNDSNDKNMKVADWDIDRGEYIVNDEIMVKQRLFDEYILDDKYRLFAVVFHYGNRPDPGHDNSGGHYIAYIRPFFDEDNWYRYDDTNPSIRLIKILPDSVFEDSEYSRPDLLMYQRIN